MKTLVYCPLCDDIHIGTPGRVCTGAVRRAAAGRARGTGCQPPSSQLTGPCHRCGADTPIPAGALRAGRSTRPCCDTCTRAEVTA